MVMCCGQETTGEFRVNVLGWYEEDCFYVETLVVGWYLCDVCQYGTVL